MNKNIIEKRMATVEDMDFIYQSLRSLASEENIIDRFAHSQEALEKIIFTNRRAEVLIVSNNGNPAALALFSETYRNFDLYEKLGMYVHDLYVLPEFRRQGIASFIKKSLKEIAVERGLGRIELYVFKDNKSALSLYESWEDIEEVDYFKFMRIKIDSFSFR